MFDKKILFIFTAMLVITLACQFGVSEDTPTPDLGPQQTMTSQAIELAAFQQQATTDAALAAGVQGTIAAQETADAAAQQTQGALDAEVEATQEVAVEETEPPEEDQVSSPDETNHGFPDTFDDNRNGWALNDIINIEAGKLQFTDIPENEAHWTTCDACLVTADQNHAEVEGTGASNEDYVFGLILDNGECSNEAIALLAWWSEGVYAIMQAVREESGDFRHWRPLKDWSKATEIKTGQYTTNSLSADYEFLNDLWITVYINDTYKTRFKTFGYNGSEQCLAGAYGEGGDININNFNIE
ncbi:hypothetical protein ACFLV7_07100 [Chloroflexota bacterium]